MTRFGGHGVGCIIETTLELWAWAQRDVKARIRQLFKQERMAVSARLFLDGLLGEERVCPERKEWRFYRMEVWPDLFGRALLMRQWGCLGIEGRRRLGPLAGAARNALAALARQKRRHGYQARTP
jgi:predicted DNA-binding WGR domain protein